MAQILVGGGSDTGTWWLRYGDVIAQIRGSVGSDTGRGGSDTETWWLRYRDVVAQIRGRGGLDTGTWWLRDGVAQIGDPVYGDSDTG